MIKIILILILSLTHPFARSGFGYTIGFSSGGQFTLPKEVGISDEVDWINYGSFMSGTLDYTHNNLIFSLGGKTMYGNLLYNGKKENNDNDLHSRYISLGFQNLLQGIKVIEKIKAFDNLSFSSSVIYSIDKYGWLKKKTTSTIGIGFSAKLISLGMWEPYISYERFKGSYSSSLTMGISLFLNNDE